MHILRKSDRPAGRENMDWTRLKVKEVVSANGKNVFGCNVPEKMIEY